MKSFYRYERYPDITAKELKIKLSGYVSLPTQFIEVYNGSDDALKDIITVFVDKDTRVLSYQPSYTQVNTFITTNSFRVGDIELLWKDYENLEYVKQSLCHQELDTTSTYVSNLSN